VKSYCGCGTGTVLQRRNEEHPPLESGTRGLVKGQQTWERLSACVVNCRMCDLTIALYIVNCN
jgi:hypothetical protein